MNKEILKKKQYKIFGDESNHLLNDKSNLMVNGAILVPNDKIVEYIKYIKYLRHKYKYYHELKWTKLYSKQFEFYKELINFFAKSEMIFKATLVLNKNQNKHSKYGRNHDDFYYISYYYTLRDFISKHPFSDFKIYLDYKDTKGGKKIKTLAQTLNTKGLNTNDIQMYIINSKESQILQLCDIFIGAISYYNRKDISKKSVIKNKIIQYLQKQDFNLIHTPRNNNKFNIFNWDLAK